MLLPERAHQNPTILRLKPGNYFDDSVTVSKGTSLDKPVPLTKDMDLRTQEALVASDILHALLGHEVSYMRFSERYNANVLHDRIHAPDYKVAKHLDISLKTISKKLLRFGKYYSGLKAFAEIYSHPLFGKVNHRLCHQIRVLLGQYRQLVAHLEVLYNTNSAYSLRTIDIELTGRFSDNLKHTYEIACSIHAVTEDRNPSFLTATAAPESISIDLVGTGENFDAFLTNIKSDIRLNGSAYISSDVEPYPVCKGGLVLRVVQSRVNQFKGDPVSSKFLTGLFEAMSQDYLFQLNLWLSSGEINDCFSEFFIKRNELPINFFYSSMEKYWQELYVTKKDGMLDQFANKDIQSKILLTGKYLNIFRQCTNNASLGSYTAGVAPLPAPIESLFSSDLTLKVNRFYERANCLLLKLLFEGFYFSGFLSALQETYLLSNSYKVDQYLAKKLPELSRGKTSSSVVGPTTAFNDMVMPTDCEWDVIDINNNRESSSIDILNVLRQFETFSVDSKSFYEIAEEILSTKSFNAEDLVSANENASVAIRRIVKQSLTKRPDLAETEKLAPAESFEEAIIAGVNIDTDLPFPLNLVLSENLLFEYQLMFKLQMMLKFTAKFLDSVWKSASTSTVWRNKNHTKPVGKLILRCRILIYRMKIFINVIENHVGFSIIDANYMKLKRQLETCHSWTNERRSSNGGGAENSSNFMSEDTPFLMSHGSANNDVFDEKISKNAKRHPAGLEQAQDVTANDLNTLCEQIGLYLSNTLRDSMITDERLLLCIRRMLSDIVDFASTVSRLKKSLILMNEILIREYRHKLPDKFGGVEFNDLLLRQRTSRLNEVLTWNWSRFNKNIGEFTRELQHSGAENPSMQTLAEKLTSV